jgi:uncharacterized protein YcbK (DUF882 family)
MTLENHEPHKNNKLKHFSPNKQQNHINNMGNGLFTTEKEKELKSLSLEIDNRLSRDEINSFERLWKETFGSSSVEIDKHQFRTWLKVSKLFPQMTGE